MLNRLSLYQTEITLSLLSVFIIGGLIPMKAQASSYGSYHFIDNGKQREHTANKKAIPFSFQGTNAATLPFSVFPAVVSVNTDHQKTGLSLLKNISLLQSPFIGGPGQPEMSSFKPAGTDNMVDLFSGDLSYNIPLLDVGGYPVNIFYNSGITMDQEASWVGLGWNINPGTITRNMRGVPDDFDGSDKITKTYSMRPDKTWGVGIGGGIEFAGFPLGLSANAGVSFNNMRGMGMESGASAHLNISKLLGDDKTGNMSLGASLGLSLNSQSGATVTPAISIGTNEKKATTGTLSASLGYNSRMGLQSLHIDAEVQKTKSSDKNCAGYIGKDKVTEESGKLQGSDYASAGLMSSSISFAYPSITPSIRTKISRLSTTASIKLGNASWFMSPNATLNGYYTQSRIADEDKVTEHPAYGLMYFQNANDNPNALLDFNRVQDGVFTKNNPTIGIPAYSYDIFSISGEGVGGTFRAYRGDLGYVHDETVNTREDAGRVGFDIGIGPLAAHGGVNLEYVYSPSVAGPWVQKNLAINTLKFRSSYGSYRSVYFKNPGEKTIPDIAFQDAVGGEDLVRLKMNDYQSGKPNLLPVLEKFNASKVYTGDVGLTTENVIRNRRDKRTQVISCLTAEEASRAGFDTEIKSYDTSSAAVIFGKCDGAGITNIKRTAGYRKGNHISQVDVLGADGRRYVYGIPVYNTKQVDATFNVTNGNKDNLQSSYTPGTDDSPSNTNNKDWFVEKEEIPAYTHSFLLTELVSPNYVDVTGNGITEDDMGDAIKFNYSEFAPVKWRNPLGGNKASYSEGLKTYNQDDKGHYTYGEREQWYLYSIESKNMVARFYVSNNRHDSREVQNMAGAIDNSYGAQKLTHIDLFSKGDIIRYGSAAKPIKSVFFEYDYSLCPNTPNNDCNSDPANTNHGKLTLKSIYFTYNGNNKQRKNKYSFHYPSAKNYAYDYTANDRWGNYKPAKEGSEFNNQGQLSTSDFPYSIQDKTKADKYAAAWVMDSIGLPAGGKIKIDYEADDYAYVQNRRAAAMYQVSGFGTTPTPNSGQLVNNHIYDGGTEYNYVYATVPVSISTTQSAGAQLNELRSKYFNSVTNQLFMRLAVDMPGDKYGSGFELIPMYADIEGYGVIPLSGYTTSNKIYIKVKRLETHSPMVQYALQFLKNNLPNQAFPGFDNTDGGLAGVIRALGGMANSLKELFRGVDDNLKANHKCREVETAKSSVRLTDPYFTKYGGGLRVKKITISDNWDKMTHQAKAVYGQEYKYTKTETVNGEAVTVSSGVASWEPTIGGEENPHREIMPYSNHNKGGPFDYNSVELPLAEMFFPSPSVGYSHVEVLPMHRDTVKNPVGKTITEFFTTKEFPTKSDYTFLEDRVNGGACFYEDPKVLSVLRIKAGKYYALSQGFKVDLNDMNGKMRLQQTIGANNMLISSTENFYNVRKVTDDTYNFNHNFPTLKDAGGAVSTSVIGRDIEIMTDFRNHNSQTISTNLNLNLDGQMIGIFPVIIPPILSPVFREVNDYKSAALLKVVTHYGMLDSVVSIDKGSFVSTKNLVYDAETGNVLLTRTNNEYDKPLYNFSYPAHWAYSGMGPAYKNIDVDYSGLVFRKGIIENAAQRGVDFSNFESGDELYVYSPTESGPFKGPCDGLPCGIPKNKSNRIWAVNSNKTGGADRFAFMDAQGNPYNATDVYMRIIRSGKRNMLEQMSGAVMSLKNPIVSNQLVFNDSTKILNTTAATFKDNWRVDDYLYRTDSMVASHDTIWDQSSYDTVSQIMTITKDSSAFSFASNEFPIISSKLLDSNANTYKSRKVWMRFDGLKTTLNSLKDSLHVYILHAYQGSYYHDDCVFSPDTLTHPGIHTVDDPWEPGMLASNTNYRNFSFYGNATVMKPMPGVWPNITDSSNWETLFENNSNYSPLYSLNEKWQDNPGIFTTHFGSYWAELGLLDNEIRFPANGMIENWINKLKNGYDINPAFSFEIFQPTIAQGIENLNCFWGKGAYLSSCLNGFEQEENHMPATGLIYIATNYELDSIRLMPREGAHSGHYYGVRTSAPVSYCKSRYSDSLINPYVQGILGNWRADSIYTYYGARAETNPLTAADMRTAGTISGYKSFWNFHTPYLQRNYSAADVWVWNSTSTQFNRKGYETENKDPLGRFNAGLYGYNQQLPVAVANNSMLREMMYDGFEDYDYKTARSCESVISDCTPMRHANFKNIESFIDSTEHHTGRFSLKVPGDSSVLLGANLVSPDSASGSYGFHIAVPSQVCNDTSIAFHGNAFRFTVNGHYEHRQFVNEAGNLKEIFTVPWEGVLVAPSSGRYTFIANTMNRLQFAVFPYGSGTPILSMDTYGIDTKDVYLEKGKSYYIVATLIKDKKQPKYYVAQMRWKTPEMWCAGQEPVFLTAPYVYKPDQAGSISGDISVSSSTIYSLTESHTVDKAFTDHFSPVSGRKMVLSAWVKESAECQCSTYVNNKIRVDFDGSGAIDFHPSGNIIEGWQRYEAVFTIPDGAGEMNVKLVNTGDASIYFDDIRIHPFNANEKSFVYHSSNLRLMAELDENNYASYYEYDDDGTLTRVKKETERGIKTITETRSALQKTE